MYKYVELIYIQVVVVYFTSGAFQLDGLYNIRKSYSKIIHTDYKWVKY